MNNAFYNAISLKSSTVLNNFDIICTSHHISYICLLKLYFLEINEIVTLLNILSSISKDIKNVEQLEGVIIASFAFVSSSEDDIFETSENTSGFLLSQYLPVHSSVHKH